VTDVSTARKVEAIVRPRQIQGVQAVKLELRAKIKKFLLFLFQRVYLQLLKRRYTKTTVSFIFSRALHSDASKMRPTIWGRCGLSI